MNVLLTEVGNASPGDEAITLAAARRLAGFGCELTVAYRTSLLESFAASGISARHVSAALSPVGPNHPTAESLLAAVRSTQPQVVEALDVEIARSQLVCIVPGGKFLDGFDNSLKLVTVALARARGVPYAILHQSVGPLPDRNERSLLQEIFASAALVIARERKTHEFLAALGAGGRRLVEAGDAAMAEEYPPAEAMPFALGINLRWSSLGHSTIRGLERFLSRYRSFDPGGRILVYSTTTSLPPEVVAAADAFGCDHSPSWCRYPAYLRLVGSCRITVADSFHGVIFGLQAGVPVVCLQADMGSWKLHGLAGDDGEHLRIFPGLATDDDAALVVAEVWKLAQMADHRTETTRLQRSLLEAGRRRAEDGWQAVREEVAAIAGRH
jgi:polysaccharide pyruvyl transferase WcaK-like protein